MRDDTAVFEPLNKPIEALKKRLSATSQGSSVGSEYRAHNRNVEKLGHLEAVRDYLFEYYPELASGQRGLTMTAEEVDRLVENASKTDDGRAVKDKQYYLVKLLDAGVKTRDWQLPVPMPVQSVQMFSSMTTPDMGARLADYDQINDAFLASLESAAPELQAEEAMERDAGELLYSLVFHSGVTARRWFNRLGEAIGNGAGSVGDYTWLELEATSTVGRTRPSTQSCRRVILAPITELLLRRWYLRWGKIWPDVTVSKGQASPDEVLLKHFIGDLVEKNQLTLNRPLNVFAVAEANLIIIAPGFLVHYARTPDLGASLSLSNWMRLLTGGTQVQPASQETQQERENEMVGSPALTNPEFPLRDQRPLFKRLMKRLRFLESEASRIQEASDPSEQAQRQRDVLATKAEVFKAMDKIAAKSGCSILVQLMCHYVRVLLRTDDGVSPALQQKIRDLQYLELLLPFAIDIPNPESLDSDEWQSIYETVVSSFPGNGGSLRRTLFEWHEFLHGYYGMPRIPMEEGAGYGVDAAILTPLEYHRAKRFLLARADDELAGIQLALLIMGFRCGLRRTECWARQYGDFHGLGDPTVNNPELLVRPTKIAGVKSDAAIRRLPLRLLLTSDELEWLTGFVMGRKLRRANDEARDGLFQDPVSGTFRLQEKWAFDGLTALLRSVSGDENIRFHHLRHSFASLSLLRLLERKPYDLLPEPWVQSDGVELMPPMHGSSNIVSAGVANVWRPLSQLAQWMGHSSERVTLKSYTHLLDLALCQYLLQEDRSYTIAQQQTLLDKTLGALERFRHRAQLKDRVTPARALAAVARMPAKGLLELPKTTDRKKELPPVVNRVAEDVNPLLPYRVSCQVFIRMQAPFNEPLSVALEKTAAQLDLDLPIVQQWYERSALLMGSSTGRTGERLRFSLRSKTSVNNTTLAKIYTLICFAPELPTYIIPPQSKSAFKECMQFFKWLSDWMVEDADSGRSALIAAAESVQRSKAELRPRGRERQIAFMALMNKLRLGARATVTLTVEKENRKAALKFWGQSLGVAQNAIVIRPAKDKKVPKHGNVSFDWKVTHKLGKHFWHAIRFVVFTGCVLYDAVPESFQNGSFDADTLEDESEEGAVPG
ncbi:hypothetical protein LWH94_12785 [Marinobacter sp. G11]|uniref:hypothetical protein n=1 Tax=Marinobacter sp. G11 TaxID=2903522 RepID=UPI001E4EC542|nr:hypothetical protein [Marinobacter sp. G11]MCE0760078.1 hypothetical protein [Marinobacter sp. G11]